MKIKHIGSRKRRGRAKFLKMGRSGVRALSDEQFSVLLSSVSPGKNSADRKQRKKILHTLRSMRRDRVADQPLIILKGFRSSEILDSLYPERKKNWLHSWQRTDSASVDLRNFSFLDNPVGTMENLRQIAECEARCRQFSINFDDEVCRDIAPYMALGLIRQKMLPVCTGCRIKTSIGRVTHAVHLDGYLRIRQNGLSVSAEILPFPLRERRGKNSSTKDNSAWTVTSEERVDSKLVDTIDMWLSKLTPSRHLSEFGRSQILTLIGEILDNAKRHSDPSEDGTWAIAGFMEARKRDDGETTAYVCHLGIINPGNTIYETLQFAPEHLRGRIDKFCQMHSPNILAKRRFDRETLWTLCSLQDGISRVSSEDTPNGFGMMVLVDTIRALGQASRPSEQPRMTIISGKACLMIRSPYNRSKKTAQGHRVLALNAANDLQYAPDEEFVFNLPYRFPGTIVAMRFCLDADELVRADGKNGSNA
jgi:hypothetical protein